MTISVDIRRVRLAELLSQKSEEFIKRKGQMRQAERDYEALRSAIDELNTIHDPFKSAKKEVAEFGWCPTCSSVLIMKNNRKYCLKCDKEVLSPTKQLVKKIHSELHSDIGTDIIEKIEG